ncbi:OmpA family protein [Bacillus sp. JJ1764]|uniref:OmpA family protein n=1 Tax=Bacillus sp. JJ1764 TaxID=3122964 RepID=UPI002FFF22EA
MSKKRRKFDDEHEEHIDESWLIPYADILTLLLALFIVLFASSNIDKQKFHSIMESFKSELTGTNIKGDNEGLSVQPSKIKLPDATTADKQNTQESKNPAPTTEDAELNNLMQQLQKIISDNHLESVITLQESKRGVEIALKDVILFDPGKDALKQSSFTTLDALANVAKSVANPISIEGHTDNVPISNSKFASNWELSSARAVSVLHYFESKSIDKSRLQFVGYGEYKPIYPNDTAEHKQSNRRVNIVILRSDQN